MGKIYKALEKSKKEQKDKAGKNLRTFGPVIKPANITTETGPKNQNKSKIGPVDGAELKQIHELLFDKDVRENRSKRIIQADRKHIKNKLLSTDEPGSSPTSGIQSKSKSNGDIQGGAEIRDVIKGANKKLFSEKDKIGRGNNYQSFRQEASTTEPDDASNAKQENKINDPEFKNNISTKPTVPIEINRAKTDTVGSDHPIIAKEKDTKVIFKESPDNYSIDQKHSAANIDLRKTKSDAAEPVIDESLITLHNPKSFESEQFKLLRTNILFPESGVAPRSILVTSALPGDGKSFVAANLAISLALGLGQHVLLVDADIRRPEIHTRFGYPMNISGLSDYLSENKPISSIIRDTHLEKLKILPGGSPSNNPSELVSSEKMVELLKELTSRYKDRCIIIDTPPPKLASEASALSRFVECVLLVVRAGKTKREVIEETIGLIGRDKIRGVIFNGFNLKSGFYANYHKYGKYYKID